ncbi:uncharacterized protein [Anabrus simplex]|uniref:uncharacterized protein n=1 Tax=Anabrus simplex TaxID=316456 RepID=UPI0035A2A964
MHASFQLVLLTSCLVLVTAGTLRDFFPNDFKFDHIEFPTELRYSPFNLRQPNGQRKQFEQASEALFAVALRLKSLLDFSINGGNFLVSPLSVAAVLGQLLLGAKGESRRKLSEILSTAKKDGAGASIPDVEYHQQFKTLLSMLETSASGNGSNHFENYELHIASAFFIQPDLRLKADYKHAVTDLYDCDVVPVNFSGNPVASQKTVNEWVRRNTRERIISLLSYPLPRTTASLIANAIYFRGAWENPFDPELTINGTFKMNSKERVAVRYMRGQFELRYAESERLGCQMVVLPYKHKQASMHIFLPFEKDYDIRNFTARIGVNDVVELKLASIERSVTLIMPKMTLSGKFSLKEPLARFQKLQETEFQGTPAPRAARPAAVSPRGRRDSRDVRNVENLLPRGINNAKRHGRDIQSENNPAPKSRSEDKSKTEVNVSKFETQEDFENKFNDSKNVTHKTMPPKVDLKTGQTNLNSEDSIETEIITSSMMVPAVPLIVMEVEKTYTVSLNNSLNINNSNTTKENFPPRRGEFNSNLKITSPLLSSFKPSNYPTQLNSPRPNNKFQRPNQPAQTGAQTKFTPTNGNIYSTQDQILFPPEDNTSEDHLSKRATTPSQISYHFTQQGNNPGFTKFRQSGNVKPVTSPSLSESYPEGGAHLNQHSSIGNRPTGLQGDDIQFDLTGASEDSRFRIDDILHEMWLEVSETGTEAAAVSAGTVDYSGDVKLVLVDRPFLFIILHEETRAILFWGAIVDPTGGTGIRTEDPLGRPFSEQSSVVHTRGR